jgi:hypothetical protein
MRSVTIHQQLEFRLESPIEFATQGDTVACSLTVKNHGNEEIALSDLALELALGDLKKVKSKSVDAFTTLSRAVTDPNLRVPAQGQVAVPWEFALDRNAPITEKGQTPFILFGNTGHLGQLQLTVKIHPHLRAILDTCETVFSLINKGEGWDDGCTTVKYKAPDLRRFSLVDEIRIVFRCVDDAIELRYSFKVKKLEATSSNVNFKRGKTEVVQVWASSDYLFGDGFIRQEYVESMLNEAFSAVTTGF